MAQMLVEAERVEEAETPVAVSSETAAEAVDESPERGEVPEDVAPANDDAGAEEPIDVSSILVRFNRLCCPSQSSDLERPGPSP